MAGQRANTDPWGNAMGQAVNAMFKYYMSRPSEADLSKVQLQQMQLQEMQRGQQMGDYTMQNLSPEIRNDLYRRQMEGRGDNQGAKLFGHYVNKPAQLDAGDTKFIVDMNTGLPMQEYGVGVAPSTQFDKENNRLITMPAIPSQNRPRSAADIISQALPPVGTEQPVNAGGISIPQVSMQDLNVSPPTGKPPMPSMFPSQEAIEGGFGTPSAGISLDGPAPSAGGVMVTPLPKSAGDVNKQNINTHNTQMRRTDFDNTFESALYNVQNGGAGVGSYMKDIPVFGGQTTAANLEADLSKIVGTATLDEITRRRLESPNGSLMGNMSDGDRKVLTDAQVAIRQSMNPQDLAYRLMMFQDLSNNVINGQGQFEQNGGQTGGTRLPSMNDIQNAQSPEQLTQMWDAFDKFPVFQGRPPKMIEDALVSKVNQLRGGR